MLEEGYFSPNDKHEFDDIIGKLLHYDQYYTLADYRSYIDAQDRVNKTYKVRIQDVFR